ncbi:UDP-glucuronosyl/UDP-glucosyltransferase [Trema orientale]|uniref:UDP-glucuronosyl/UDP-glucosyltransferase n=1 Tax=Trema orientale TaxID=63057 RepID=A0A2P5FCI9_TREOI|nr:UDP-glucuronosyl/UDP-glucosyltransferase [Trema orientale]
MVLVNIYDELEDEALRAVSDHLSLMGIGPLIPSAFLDDKDPSDKFFGGELFQGSEDKYIEWLDSKPKTTIVYVSFGSMSVLSKPRMEEIAKGLLDFGRSSILNDKKDDYNHDQISCGGELEKLGMIVPWCSQVLEVLSNESLGCFVTHCGWNSTLEILATRVPMVAFPQWIDQGTNAKLIEDMWKTGLIRVNPNDEGIVKSGEIKRYLELVMGRK